MPGHGCQLTNIIYDFTFFQTLVKDVGWSDFKKCTRSIHDSWPTYVQIAFFIERSERWSNVDSGHGQLSLTSDQVPPWRGRWYQPAGGTSDLCRDISIVWSHPDQSIVRTKGGTAIVIDLWPYSPMSPHIVQISLWESWLEIWLRDCDRHDKNT